MRYLSLLIFTAFLAGCYARIPEKTGLEGKPIPHFSILETDSSTYIQTENIPVGKPTVLIYFGPFCTFSRAQAHDLVNSIEKAKNIDFYFISTSPIVEIKDFVQQFGLDKYRNVIVGQDYKKFFGDYYEALGVPFTAIYGKNGKMKAAFQGQVSAKQIRNCAQD